MEMRKGEPILTVEQKSHVEMMKLRDQFAMAALTGLLGNKEVMDKAEGVRKLALMENRPQDTAQLYISRMAYKCAEAMMEARTVQP